MSLPTLSTGERSAAVARKARSTGGDRPTRRISAVAAALVAALTIHASGARAAAGCAPAGHFVVDGAEFTDTRSRTVWRRCSGGQAWSPDGRCVGTARPMNYAEALAAVREAGPPWRLPTADELRGLLDTTCSDPVADPAVLPAIPIDPNGGPSVYWSSTPMDFKDMQVTVDFRYGFVEMHAKDARFFLRLVRPAN